MCRTCGKRHNSYSMDPNSNGPQDVSLEPAGSIPFCFGLPSPGKTSPLRGRNMKEYEEQLEHLKKENFSLKLRIYFLEEKISHKGIKEDKEELYKANIELKVETEALKKQLCDKQELVRQAAGLLTNLENQFKEQLQTAQETHEKETENLKAAIASLQKDLNEYSEKVQHEGGGDLTRLCGLAFSSAAEDPTSYAELDRSSLLANGRLMPPAHLQGVFSMQDPMEPGIDERSQDTLKNAFPNNFPSEFIPESAKNKIKELEEEVSRLTNKVQTLQDTIKDKERISKALEEDIINLKKEIEDREEKMADFEIEVNEKDQKIDQLMQELETRHLEIEAKDSTIQTLHDDLNKVEPQIEVKVQEIRDRDRIIEEKTEQLQQQNKILVEIQITLDEKQKQIAELEESLLEARQAVEKLNKDFDFSLRTIKEMAGEVMTRDKEIAQLKKELKKKDKKVKDLLAELKEAMDMLQKAKWEAETSGGQDGVKEMVEEENERLWAELEQRKLELANVRGEKDSLAKEAQSREVALIKQKEEAEEKLRLLQKQIRRDVKGDRDKVSNIESVSLEGKVESRESLLKSQEVVIEALKSDLAKAKNELNERKDELKDLKRELLRKNNDMQDFFSKELFGRNKELQELQRKLCSMPIGPDNPLETLKLLIEANQMKFTPETMPSKVTQHVQARSNSLSKLSDQPLISSSNKENTSSQQGSKAARSNSFSLLENMLYANMGQKVYNTNQTFNTYVLSGDAEGKQGEVIPLGEGLSPIPSEALKMGLEAEKELQHPNKGLLATILCKEASKSSKSTVKGVSTVEGIKESSLPSKRNVELEICSVSDTQNVSDNALQLLYEEVSTIRNEAQALRKDREILSEKVSALQALNEQLSNDAHEPERLTSNEREVNISYTEMRNNKDRSQNEVVADLKSEIENVKVELKGTKQKVTLNMLQMASTKYQDSLKNYKQEIISLRKRLADSHNACDLLRNRLEELVDFFEQILDMDRKGIINLSHLSAAQRSALQKSLEDSRSLSHSLSHSLMIGTDSLLGDSLTSINDEEASRFCFPLDNLPEEVDFSDFDYSNISSDMLNHSELSAPELTKDFMYYSFASKISSHIDSKAGEIDAFAEKLCHLSNLIESKDEQINIKANTVKCLQNQIAKLKKEVHLKNRLLMENQTDAASIDRESQGGSCPLIEIQSESNSSLHLSALHHSLISPNIDSFIHEGLFTVPGETSSSDTLPPPPPPPYFSSQDECAFISTEKHSHFIDKPTVASLSDVGSAYSTDIVVKNLPTRDASIKNVSIVSQQSEQSGMNLEQPSLPPTFALASPSESEAWSEPDRNVSLARIGLETCNLVSTSHDRSLSRSRMTRSAPFTSESEGEGNAEEVKESSVGLGTPSTKPKRRTDAAEVKRLTSKLKSVEQLNETLRAELHIYQTLNQQFTSSIEKDKNYQMDPSKSRKEKYCDTSVRDSEEFSQQNEFIDSNCSFVIPSSLLQEIRSLRMKLEEAITNNDLLRDQLEAALSGYLSEETRNLTSRLSSIQQDLKMNQERLFIAANTEQQLRIEVKEHETKMFELGERLADYMTINQKLESKVNELNQDLQKSRELLNKTEEELKIAHALGEERELSSKELRESSNLQMQMEMNSLKLEIKKLQQNEKEKERKVEEQKKYIMSLEESKADYESKLSEQDLAIKELCNSINTLQQENNKSSVSDHLISKLQEALQSSEGRLLQITKERFALLGEKTRLQAQLASVTTHASLLQKEVRELSVSSDTTESDIGYKQLVQKLKAAQITVKELQQHKELLLTEKQALQKEMQLMQEEISALRAHLDHVLSREAVTNSREIRELASLQISYESVREKYVTLENVYQNVLLEKTSIENKLKDVQTQEKEILQLKTNLKENELKKDEIVSQLDAERCLTKNLQIQIKNMQHYSSYPKVPSDHSTRLTIVTSRDFIRPGETSPVKLEKNFVSPLKESSFSSSWIEDKENQFPRYQHPRGTLSLPNIDDDVTSGDSPDLGIGSDGQFSSLERLGDSRLLKGGLSQRIYTIESKRIERNNKLCSEPSHSQLFSDIERLRMEREDLNSKLISTKESLREALCQLSKANQKKESVERAICKQLTKTHDVLRRAKGNLCQEKGRNACRQIPSTNES